MLTASEKFSMLQHPYRTVHQILRPWPVMSTSESGDYEESSVSSVESGSDASVSEIDDFPSEQPRKKRRITPPTEGASQENGRSSAQAPLSRIKTKKSGTQAVTATSKELASGSTQANEAISFASLNVKPWLVTSLANMAITKPTGIQRGCIPEILKGRDCIGGSRTGSGKTVAFAVPMLQKWAEDPFGIYAVVLTPTRELALQIFEQFKALSAAQSFKPILVTGGADMREQALSLAQRPHVVIATPGRLAEHINVSGEDTICGLRRVRFVVLDEADRLLASGPGSMLPDVEQVMSVLPPSTERQTLLFTATVTPEVRALKEMPPKPGKGPPFVCEVDTEDLAVPTTLQQRYLLVPVTQREPFLHVLLLTPANVEKSVIIFCNTKATATFLEHMLRLLEHRVTSLHAGLPQPLRIANLARFRARAARILIATDVAARGLDIPEVELVINYDVPRDPDDYIHRVGRTARAGRRGESLTFVGQRDVQLVKGIEERVGSKMVAYEEEGVNLETRVVRDALKIVGEKKREAFVQIDEGRTVTGKRRKGMVKLNKR
ncbi:uncharacterized protein PV09_07392 [Verruconis gallopava]|uniref:ATP-dependent RNA helicase DBP8 n=1 Tax=Verruconis gallopava TaxID=253628 RepID=A0A0D2A3T5_9PEZI|nr:uncharacterized protein PV09_07392 [Verruconis gallopava]KIW01105.1 hypothetical protein PV09_07392 [Verruconis gallopava]